MPRPEPGTFAAYYTNYIAKVKEDELPALMSSKTSWKISSGNFRGKANYAYAPGKWTIKELLQYVIDTNGFSYRAAASRRRKQSSRI